MSGRPFRKAEIETVVCPVTSSFVFSKSPTTGDPFSTSPKASVFFSVSLVTITEPELESALEGASSRVIWIITLTEGQS
jgi:hypothetical protein